MPTTLAQLIMRRVWRSTFWLPVVFFSSCITAGILVHQFQQISKTERIQQGTAITAEQLKHRLEAWVDHRVSTIEQFGNYWGQQDAWLEKDFVREAKNIQQMYPGLLALNLIDQDWVISITVPAEANRTALGKDLHAHPSPSVPDAIARAIKTRHLTGSPLIMLLQGQPGFTTYCPVFKPDGTVRGFLNGVFLVEFLVDACFSEERLRERFDFALYTASGKLAYASTGEVALDPAQPYAATETVCIVDKQWKLVVVPSAATLRQSFSLPDRLLVGGGLTLAILLTFLLRAYLLRVAELRDSREKFRLLIENQADMVIKISPLGHVEFVSPTFLQTVGLRENQVLGEKARKFVNPDHWPAVFSYVRNLRVGDELDIIELQLLTPDGMRWTSWTGSVFRNEDDRPGGFVGVGRDITQLRELEDQLRQSQKLQAVGQLAGGIAHDFNNIIQALIGYLGFAREDLPEDSPVQGDLAQATFAAERAAELTRQLLAFSRRQMLKTENLDINEVTRALMPMLERLLDESITLEFQSADHPCMISADRGQIEQILVNLCVNARDAIQEVGRIVVSTSEVDIDDAFCRIHPWAEAGAWVRLSLKDTGKGMDTKTIHQIFEPFFTTKKTGQGTGLGLSTVYGIVKQHNGLINVESTPDHGSTFHIFLPRALKQASDRMIPGTKDPRPGEEVILLAEDEDMVRNLCSRILTSAGYRVLAAADGQEALNLFKAHRANIQMALLDMVMPRMGGRELSLIILEMAPALPILFTSGYDSETFNEARNQIKADSLLPKPYDKNTLLTRVRETLDRAAGSNT